MKRIHPYVSRAATRAATCATIALSLGFGGCRSTSTGITNPFMSPDRVPPPATHVLLPGQAQPYYQGDPLPAAQARTNPSTAAAASQVAVRNDAAALSCTGRTLAWAAPGSAPASPAANAVPPAATAAPAAPQVAATANEAPVAVPADSDPLRFALPAPQKVENVQPVVAAAPQPNGQPVQPPVAQPMPAVQLATYNAPVAANQPAPTPVPTLAAQPQINTPWRTPQIPTSAAPTYGAQPGVVQTVGTPPMSLPAPPVAVAPPAQPVAVPANTMPVTLQAVASPPVESDTIPRIRMPGYVAQQVTATDGFRPRTSMQ